MNKYSIEVAWSEEDEAWIATCAEFPGLSAFGDSRIEALELAEVFLQDFIEVSREQGMALPEPRLVREYSGQLRLRMSKSTHAQLALRADREGVSLNQLANDFINQGIGRMDCYSQIIPAAQECLRTVLDEKLQTARQDDDEVGIYQDPILRALAPAHVYSND